MDMFRPYTYIRKVLDMPITQTRVKGMKYVGTVNQNKHGHWSIQSISEIFTKYTGCQFS